MFEGFPKTRLEFEKRFSTQKDCLGYLSKLRWKDGPLKAALPMTIAAQSSGEGLGGAGILGPDSR